jgi:hypothetical protein
MAYSIPQQTTPAQTVGAAAAPKSKDIWSDIFGGTNKAGFFGGGQYQANAANFNLPGYQQSVQAYTNLANQALGGGQSQFSGQQEQLAQNLFGTLKGNTPSVAQQQLQQTTQGNVANAYALAASGRYNPAAARMAADNAAAVNQQAAGQGAMLRAQEIQNAQGQLGNVLGQGRAQDIGQFQAQNQEAQAYLNQQLTAQQAQQQGQEAYENAQQAGLSSAQQNSAGGKILSAAAAVAGGVAKGAHGGEVQTMGETRCPGCGHKTSECTCWQQHLFRGGAAKSFEEGGGVQGSAKTSGDSLNNDVVKALLSPGEIVLPRSITRDEDAPELAKAFVKAIKAAHRKAA